MRYLTAKEILVLHALVVDETGGSHGVRDVSLLASIAHKSQAEFSGKELYRGIFKKTAILLEAITNYHVFVDGNKRTALVGAARFLYLNEYELTATNKDAEKIVMRVANKEIDMKQLTAWLKKNSKSITRKRGG